MGCLRVTFTIVLAQALYYQYYNLLVTATAIDKFTDPIDTKNYQEYLLSSTIEHSNHSRKFIVDTLWTGISKLPKHVLKDNSGSFEFCLSALREYAQATTEQHKLWALKMYDASSGIPPGFLTGNVQEIGSYDECVQIHTETLTGKFCAVKLNKTMTEHIALADIPVSYYLCIPSVCTARNIQNIINIGARTISPNISFVADESSCFVKKNAPLNFYDWFAIIIFTAIIGLCILGTALECVKFHKPGTIRNAVLAFSLRTNCQHLFGVVKHDDLVNSLYGLRFLLMVWILLIHRYSQVHTVPTMGLFNWNTLIQDWSRVIITNGYICVDTFFVMGGMLLSYTFLNKMDKGINFQVGKFYLHRYIRLTPALAGMVLFYATISDRFCEGPLCNNYYNAIKKPCVSNWWSALFYVNNYYETDNMCGTQTWYTSIDMQLYLLSPILLYPLIKHPWTVRYLLSSLIVISIVISIFQPYYNHIAAGYFIVGKAEDHRIFLNNYTFTHTRAASWLIGFGMGIYLHKFKRNPRKLSTKTVVFGWTLTVWAFVGVIFSILPLQQESHQYDPVYDTLYKSIHRHIWAVASCWFIFACATGYGGFVNKFLSWKGLFQPLGRLTYCINLTHILVLKLQMGAQRTPVNFTDITQITLAFGDIMASVFLAIILYLLFEAPGCALERMLLSSDKKNKNSNNAFEEELQI